MDREEKKIVIRILNEIKDAEGGSVQVLALNEMDGINQTMIDLLELNDLIEFEDERCFLTETGYDTLEEGRIDIGQHEKIGGLSTALNMIIEDFQAKRNGPKKGMKKYMWIILGVQAVGLTYYFYVR